MKYKQSCPARLLLRYNKIKLSPWSLSSVITPEHEHILAVKMVILIAKPSKCDLKKLFTEWSGLPCRQIISKIVCVVFGFIENSLKASKWLFLEAVYAMMIVRALFVTRWGSLIGRIVRRDSLNKNFLQQCRDNMIPSLNYVRLWVEHWWGFHDNFQHDKDGEIRKEFLDSSPGTSPPCVATPHQHQPGQEEYLILMLSVIGIRWQYPGPGDV